MSSRIRRFLAVPIFADEEKNRAARFLNSLSWSAMTILLLIILMRVFIFQNAAGSIAVIMLSIIVLILGIVQVSLRLGYVRGASIFLVFSTWTAMTYLLWAGDGIHDVAAVSYLVIILLASLLLGWRTALLVASMSIGVVWYFAFLEKNGLRAVHMDDPLNYARDLTVIFLVAGALIYLLIANLNRSLREARLELKERLRAEAKLQRQADYLTALHETTLGLVHRLELHPLLESILTRACELVGSPHGSIDLILPDGSAMQQELGRGSLAQYNHALTLKNEGATGRAWASGETVFVPDYAEWEGRIPSIAALGFHGVICVPLKSENTVIGALSMAQMEAGKSFTPEQITLLERFAALASIAIDSARLYEQSQLELKERRATEIALRASEERFRKIFLASPVAICTTSLEEGRLLDANDAYWALSGLEPRSSLGRTVLELGLYPDPETRASFLNQLMRARSISDPDYQFRTAKGHEKSVIAFYELVELAEETTILSMFYDVSEQKQAQAALQASEERFRKVF